MSNIQNTPTETIRRLKHLAEWSNNDVMKWSERHYDQHGLYGKLFAEHSITGRSLCRITNNILVRIGIPNQNDRDELRRVIIKLKLKSDMVKLKDLERSG